MPALKEIQEDIGSDIIAQLRWIPELKDYALMLADKEYKKNVTIPFKETDVDIPIEDYKITLNGCVLALKKALNEQQ